MPNLWEAQYGLNPNDSADAALDPDRDGHTNVEEYLAGTRPNDDTSVLALATTLHEQTVTVSFEAQAGRAYVLWSTADLANGKWIQVQAFQPEGAKRTVTYGIPAVHLPLPNGYYRLTIPAAID